MLHALSLGLKQVRRCDPNGLSLVICGGGPSLADTYKKLKKPNPKQRIVAVNGSHDWLIERGIVPYGCSLMDPHERLAEMITPNKRVAYFVASTCHPAVFERLKGHHVFLWHASGQLPDEVDILNRHSGEWMLVGGGSTVSLRWIALGYILGFRDFRLHGFDSSSRRGKRHAYDQDDGELPPPVMFRGYETTPQWLGQLADFFAMLERMTKPDMQKVSIRMYGDGLLQSQWKLFQRETGSKAFS